MKTVERSEMWCSSLPVLLQSVGDSECVMSKTGTSSSEYYASIFTLVWLLFFVHMCKS